MATPKFRNYISKKTGSPQAVLVEIKIEGLQDVMEAAAKIGSEGPKAMGRALYAEGLYIMTKAKLLTPVRYGFLRASGRLDEPVISYLGTNVSVEMGFGGPAGRGNLSETNTEEVGYALPVHEDLNAYHKVGQAKFLEQPLLAAMANMERELATRIKADLRL